MGQYYKFIILADDKEVILLVVKPHDYMNGAKLMEHSYINTDMMNTIEHLIGHGQFKNSRCVWAGDYADEEENMYENLYRLADNYSSYNMIYKNVNYRYIVNHTQKLYIDKSKLTNNIHPLPLLISEGNGKGGGDYDGINSELCGTWARNNISMDNEKPENYNEFICLFENN